MVAMQRQTMNRIVDTCPLTKSEGVLNLLHESDDDAVMWLESTATAALAKLNNNSHQGGSTRNPEVARLNPLSSNNLGQVVRTPVSASQSSINCDRSNNGDALRLGR